MKINNIKIRLKLKEFIVIKKRHVNNYNQNVKINKCASKRKTNIQNQKKMKNILNCTENIQQYF